MSVATLKDCPVFSSLTASELESLNKLAVTRQYEAGVTIFKENRRAEEILVIQEGKVAVQIDMPMAPPQKPKKVTVDIIGKNELVGWSSFIEPDAYILTAVCLQNTTALAINDAKLRQLLHDDCQLGFNFLSGLIKVANSRLHETIRILISERSYVAESG